MWHFKNYKRLTEKEHKELLKIRNQAHIRNAANNSAPISLEAHLAWVDALPKEKRYFAFFIDTNIYGGLYYIAERDSVREWGIFFDASADPLVTLSANYLFIEHMFQNVATLYSEILLHNEKALRFNRYFGIEVAKETQTHYKMTLTKRKWQEHKKTLTLLEKRIEKIDYLFTI